MGTNTATARRRSPLGMALAIIVLAAAVLAVLALAGTRIVELRIANMLGPRAQVGNVQVGFKQLVLTDVKIAGSADAAPASARRVVAEPEWTSFLRHEAVFRKITIEGFDFAVLRTPDGDMQISPALQAALREADGGSDGVTRRKHPIRADDIVLTDGRLDFLDAAIAKPPHRIPFNRVSARLTPLVLPAGGQRSDMEFKGSVEDNRNGAATVTATGSLEVGGTDADIKVAVRNMDIRYAAPYLAENGAGSLSGGAMDLDMQTRIAKRQLKASGVVALRDLKFSGDGSLFSLPRKAVLAAMQDRSGALRMEFSLSGSLDNPKFSASRGFAAQIARGVGHMIGVGAEGAAGGVAGAVKDVGDAISDLFSPNDQKR
ncbi:DUF748 domain-containing protein [Achromobacter sp. UMC71]|uniref:DUF748 domain-containing protein n=1 Tax=Achromobacter sp. UMC71 TaxID=1862320 RepID=UPI001601E902|nr:DUF748 domain-containing protein [Achromobacter sp. UMC71]MBB1624714.1 hypothetical protein [Achromobacter sp. UMC71]